MIYTTYTHEQLLQMQPLLVNSQIYIERDGKTYKVKMTEQGNYKLKEVLKEYEW